ncbi:hypothetical protein [Streptomyces sp. 3N207]|uniref:hypothetical protein n=1 Tax=Streptomyces sp. 3N207 TaxID=3457417 RepID=UPI003FD66CD2
MAPRRHTRAAQGHRLPVGLLLTAGDHQDAELLSLVAAVEHRLDAWRPPRYLP